MAAPHAVPPVLRDTADQFDEPIDVAPPDSGALVEHPDGYYWLARDGSQQFGPFATVADAMADMNASADDALEPGETLEEVEQELGVADWVDPETGELAEETHARIEEH
jgi:hypothetical protein